MTSQVESMLDGLFDLVFPPKCISCGNLNPHYLCASCLTEIAPVPRPYCMRCGHPMFRNRCSSCWGRVRSFEAARAAGDYSGILRDAIHAFKYGGARALADPLAHLLCRYLTMSSDIPWRRAECIIPVPMYPAKERIRGYNQSVLLAECLGDMIGLPVLTNVLQRRVSTKAQVALSGKRRRENVVGAFGVSPPEAGELSGKTVLLVDDVATTCSTIHECSVTLLGAGARRVYVACLAFGA